MSYSIFSTLYGYNRHTTTGVRGPKGKKGDPGNTTLPHFESIKIQDILTKTVACITACTGEFVHHTHLYSD